MGNRCTSTAVRVPHGFEMRSRVLRQPLLGPRDRTLPVDPGARAVARMAFGIHLFRHEPDFAKS